MSPGARLLPLTFLIICHLAPVFAIPVEVGTSQDFAAALLNVNCTEVLLTAPPGVQEVCAQDGGLVSLLLSGADFKRSGPVRVAAGQQITVKSGYEDVRWVLDFGGISAAIVIDYNSTLVFQHIRIQGAAIPSANGLPLDAFAGYVPQVVTGSTLVAYPGATVGFLNVIFLEKADSCLDYANAVQYQITDNFGGPALIEQGLVTSTIVGRHTVKLPSNATSTQANGAPVTIILEGVTSSCAADQDISPVPDAPLSFVPFLDALQINTLPAGLSIVSNGHELVVALQQSSVSTVYLVKQDGTGFLPVNVVLQRSDFGEPLVIDTGRHVSLVSGSPALMSTLDFNLLRSAFLLRPNSSLAFQNLFLCNVSSSAAINKKNYLYPAAPLFWAWPSIIVEPGGEVTLLNTTVSKASDCSYFVEVLGQQQMMVYGPKSIVMPDDRSVTLLGQHASKFPLHNLSTGRTGVASPQHALSSASDVMLLHALANNPQPEDEAKTLGHQERQFGLCTVGEMELIVKDSTSVCLDEDKPESSQNSSTDTARGASHPSHSLVLGLGIGLGGGLLLMGVLAAYIASRGCRKRGPVLLEASIPTTSPFAIAPPPFSGEDPPPNCKSEESVESSASQPHGTLWQLRYLGDLEDEHVEIGPLLGRGGFGRVYKGRWKGAVIAVKVVDHAVPEPGVTADLRSDRESLLSTSLSHPNVATTYKICTTQASDSTAAGRGRSRRGSPGEGPSQGSSTTSGIVEGSSGTSSERHQMMETWLIMEYCDRGSLADAIRLRRFYNKTTNAPDLLSVYRCLLDVATGLDYLHSAGIVHGDLKPGNVLLKSTTSDARGFICKLADFGLSRILTSDIYSHVITRTYGTVAYMPPELLKTGHLSRPADVWSFSLLMWSLFTGEAPYADLGVGQVFYKTVIDNERPTIPRDCPAEYKRLMEACWSTDADDRPSMAVVMKSLNEEWQLLRAEKMANRANSG